MKLSFTITAFLLMVGLVAAQDLSKYNLSWCAENTLVHTSGILSGEARDNERSPYADCVYIYNGQWFDYQCLCAGGDGEGSAIMSEAMQIGHVWYHEKCGWENMFDVYFPEIRDFCRKAMKDDAMTRPKHMGTRRPKTTSNSRHRRRQALKKQSSLDESDAALKSDREGTTD
ncbi:hypothetical protein B0T20DRAFT_412075 [Sordaria brevicollis]|uniref:Uncharacterized protein n=1 Tax=Sordaria brevicollis TaxID=83679 RepID=A0AAE0PFB1_SORBR|nr:hypothetical protein B0T20DRAFT_412075 [Sordaria brevicollis]